MYIINKLYCHCRNIFFRVFIKCKILTKPSQNDPPRDTPPELEMTCGRHESTPGERGATREGYTRPRPTTVNQQYGAGTCFCEPALIQQVVRPETGRGLKQAELIARMWSVAVQFCTKHMDRETLRVQWHLFANILNSIAFADFAIAEVKKFCLNCLGSV